MIPRLYYHTSTISLRPGLELEGRFGVSQEDRRFYAILRSALKGGESTVKALLLANPETWPMYLKEYMFECVRQREFADRPRRFGGIFLWRTLEDAVKFQRGMGDRPHMHLCQVEGGTLAELDAMLASAADPLAPLRQQREELEGKARRYWTGDRSESPVMEVVTNNAKVTIVEALP